LVLLNEKEQIVRADRVTDHDDYNFRVLRTEETIEALNMILPKLRSLSSQSMEMAFVELSKIGKSNPIGAFMQIASTIDEGMLKATIEKMEELLESLAASLEEDQIHEIQSQADYEMLLIEIAAVRDDVTVALDADRIELAEYEGKLANEERYLEE